MVHCLQCIAHMQLLQLPLHTSVLHLSRPQCVHHRQMPAQRVAAHISSLFFHQIPCSPAYWINRMLMHMAWEMVDFTQAQYCACPLSIHLSKSSLSGWLGP